MTARDNPLKLNPLQLKTLTLLQVLAQFPEAATPDAETGGVRISRFPQAHGDHFHLGNAVVRGADATGLANQSVWAALEKKGLAKSNWPQSLTLTPAGLQYATGMENQLLQQGGH